MKRYAFVLSFMLILAYPLYGSLTDRFNELHGVSSDMSPGLSGSALYGDFQSEVNTRFEQRFPGRGLLIRMRNQMLYGFGVSPNSNVLIGKDRCLFEPADVLLELCYYPPCSDAYFSELGARLASFRDLMESTGREVYVFITPYKPRYFEEEIPLNYRVLSARQYYPSSNRELLRTVLEENGISYFDASSVTDRALDEAAVFHAPVFSRTGKHWTRPWGALSAKELLSFIGSRSRFSMGAVSVEEIASDTPVFPDADLYDTFNLFARPKGAWYDARVTVAEGGADHPGIFARGGSFMGQSVSYLLETNLFGSTVHFENDHYSLDHYASTAYISRYDAYEETDLGALLKDADIVLLEVNEGSIDRMSFGFMEYVLEHPECVRE